MNWLTLAAIVLCLAGLIAGRAEGQVNPYSPRQPPNPRFLRLMRERAVWYAGPSSRALVEAGGEDAVAAILNCSQATAQRLAEFYSSGELTKLSRPRDLLRVIAQPNHGDDVALYAIAHADMLKKPDYLDMFLAMPLEYALSLRNLEADVAARRASAVPAIQLPEEFDRRWIVGAVGAVGVVGLLIWWKRRR